MMLFCMTRRCSYCALALRSSSLCGNARCTPTREYFLILVVAMTPDEPKVVHIHTQQIGAALLSNVEAFLVRFIAYPSEQELIAHTLWIAHTHGMSHWESTPRIAFLSPEPGSGKTRALEVTELLVPRPVEAINVTPAYLFRKISDEAGRPTILYDEIDTIFGPKAKDNEEIRGVLNAGHRKGAKAGRCVVRGRNIETEELDAYCAVAMAGLGNLPDTLLSRSIVVRMRRRSQIETVEPFRRRVHAAEGEALRDSLADWVSTLAPDYPAMPAGVEDRDADVWEPLISIADCAGGEWPKRSRVNSVNLVNLSRRDSPSLGVRLLSDLRVIFGDEEQLHTDTILDGLCCLDESPWNELRGKPLNARSLANYLRQYDVRSKMVRVGVTARKGYTREDLLDPWDRYVPSTIEGSHGSQGSHLADPLRCPHCDGEGCQWCNSSLHRGKSYEK